MAGRSLETLRGPAPAGALGLGSGLVHVGEARRTDQARTPQGEPAVETWAPQFRRPSATRAFFENERVIGWGQIYQNQAFMHRHVRGKSKIVIEDGLLTVMERAGNERVTPSPNKGRIGPIGCFKASLGLYSEVAADPNRRRRIMYMSSKASRRLSS
jgi:hypothetical protein